MLWLPYITKNETAQLSSKKINYDQRIFFVNLLHAIQKYQTNKSYVFSPHSIHRILLLVYFGTNSLTEKSLKKLFKLEAIDKADISHLYELEKIKRTNFREQQTVEFKSVEKIYFSNNIKVSFNITIIFFKNNFHDVFKNCRDGVKESFNIEMLNFAFEPEKARVHINKFIVGSTKDSIKDFLSPDSISPDTEIVLVNVAFFKGYWESEFNKLFTHKSVFYEHGHIPVHIDMMTQTGHFNYGMIC